MLFLTPLAVSAGTEYLFCRLPKRRFWRWVPPAAALVVTAAVTLFRWHGWSDEGTGAPLETLLFFPGLPALGVFLGLFAGWRVYRRLWLPRVVKKKEGKK